MCGIVGGVSERNVVPIILEGLSRLEYRGYDSVGIAIIDDKQKLVRERVTDRVKELENICKKHQLKGCMGIGHTRWATHGVVTEANAHPHFSHDELAIVHNGIIENYVEIKEDLINKGYVFKSDTDSEVIVHLIHSYYIKNNDLLSATKLAVKKLHGAYAIAVICKNNIHEVVCARLGSPLVLGVGINEMFFASDIAALLPITNKVIYLEDGDIASIELANYKIYDNTDKLINRVVVTSDLLAKQSELGQYRHYMQKEIFEQPTAIAETLQSLGNFFNPKLFGREAKEIFEQIDQVQIIACGTSYNAGLIAKYWIEEIAKLECNVDIASEYRYRKIPINNKTLIISISQSGETADTLACVKYMQELGMVNTLTVCNVPESSLVRLSKLKILTQAGPEIGVASTKAFTTQLVVLLYLAATLAKVRGNLTISDEQKMERDFKKLPQLVLEALKLEPEIKKISKEFEHKEHALFLGRNTMYPIAMEGALKLKEISYIHAEAYAAGELKHGPLALIDRNMPSIIIMPKDILMSKMKSNVQEILARHGIIYLLTDSDDEILRKCHKVIQMPLTNIESYLLPIIYTIPLQLLAYHTALIKGTDVDKPRNLAKSVTVE